MIVACVKNCTDKERDRIGESLDISDRLLFFRDYEELAESAELENIEVVFGEPPIKLVENMSALRWIQMTWAGTDMYTQSGKLPEGILLTNTSGAFGKIISEYILAGLLSMNRKLYDYRTQIQSGGWQLLSGERTLEGRKALILGAGDIGCETARKLKAFDVKVWGIRRVQREKPGCFDAMYTMDELDELLPQVDMVISCLPGTIFTKGLLNEKRLRMMKKDAWLVNVGRGSIIPLEDLTRVLDEGHLGGVILDVLETEPCPKNHPLRHYDRVLLTPHMSGVSWGDIGETREKIIDIFCENLKLYHTKKRLLNLVDMQQGYRETQSV